MTHKWSILTHNVRWDVVLSDGKCPDVMMNDEMSGSDEQEMRQRDGEIRVLDEVTLGTLKPLMLIVIAVLEKALG